MDKKQLSKLALMGLVMASSGSNVSHANEGTSLPKGQRTLLAKASCGAHGCGGAISMEDKSNFKNQSHCGGNHCNGMKQNGQTGPKNQENNNSQYRGTEQQQPQQQSSGNYYNQRGSGCAGQTYRNTADTPNTAQSAQQRNIQNYSWETNRNFQDTQTDYYSYPTTQAKPNYNTTPQAYDQGYDRANIQNQDPNSPTYNQWQAYQPNDPSARPQQRQQQPTSYKNPSSNY